MTTTPFFHPSTIDIVHAADHNRVRAEHGLPPRLHGRRSVRDEHGVIEWCSIEQENDAAFGLMYMAHRVARGPRHRA